MRHRKNRKLQSSGKRALDWIRKSGDFTHKNPEESPHPELIHLARSFKGKDEARSAVIKRLQEKGYVILHSGSHRIVYYHPKESDRHRDITMKKLGF